MLGLSFGILSAASILGTVPTLVMPADFSLANNVTSPSKTIAVGDSELGALDLYIGTDDETLILAITVIGGNTTTWDFGFGSINATHIQIAGPGNVSFTVLSALLGSGLVGIYAQAVDSGGLKSDVGITNINLT